MCLASDSDDMLSCGGSSASDNENLLDADPVHLGIGIDITP